MNLHTNLTTNADKYSMSIHIDILIKSPSGPLSKIEFITCKIRLCLGDLVKSSYLMYHWVFFVEVEAPVTHTHTRTHAHVHTNPYTQSDTHAHTDNALHIGSAFHMLTRYKRQRSNVNDTHTNTHTHR